MSRPKSIEKFNLFITDTPDSTRLTPSQQTTTLLFPHKSEINIGTSRRSRNISRTLSKLATQYICVALSSISPALLLLNFNKL